MNVMKIALGIGIVGLCALPAMAGPHHGRDHVEGVRLAKEIVGLVANTLRIPAAVAAPPAVVPVAYAPVVHCPPPPPPVPAWRPAPVRHMPVPPPRHHGRPGHHRR